ncbi:hypothetical protein PIB30_007856 [Stylosanthes scabra]|uniref:Uncharacterized protein n=1 Tax=Stylosanthes scabra TaxID=79078 RepID=A0ABU6R3J5_9FABA|nr:hypothetical protein [Stylosanthes scabra]
MDNSKHNFPVKPVPVNLINSLANLSVNSHTDSKEQEGQAEVTSKILLPSMGSKEKVNTAILPVDGDMAKKNTTDLVFAAAKSASTTNSARVSLKKQARKKFTSISGTKRINQGEREDQTHKKLCS